MANLRESVGRSTTSHNLGMSDWSERDIDRVAALGCAARFSPLGADLFRWAYAEDSHAAVRVLVPPSRWCASRTGCPSRLSRGSVDRRWSSSATGPVPPVAGGSMRCWRTGCGWCVRRATGAGYDGTAMGIDGGVPASGRE